MGIRWLGGRGLHATRRWEIVWLCVHWVVQDTKQHPFLIHAVTSVCSALCTILFFFPFFLFKASAPE